MSNDVRRWMETVTGPGWFWYVKRLSGNDTLLNQAHQAGPYVPRNVVFALFPSLTKEKKNPRAEFGASIDSHNTQAWPQAIWYNNKFYGGTRNECRITNWGGRSSPLLDPEATGSICVLAFEKDEHRDAHVCCVWVCSSIEEEDAIEDRVGPIEPGLSVFYDASGLALHPITTALRDSSCVLGPHEIPDEWRLNFPDASSIVRLAVERLPTAKSDSADQRLLRRRECEYAIFRSVEETVVMPRIREGFATVDLFVDFANSVTNRRKSRSGASLELHARTIFREEALDHSHDEVSEGSKRPDFLFPSAAAYGDPAFPSEKLTMLGVKTTCKDRWRQIINEADRTPQKFLLTLQEGVSLAQFGEMQAAKVCLVVPEPLHSAYESTVRPHLLTLETFIAQTKARSL